MSFNEALSSTTVQETAVRNLIYAVNYTDNNVTHSTFDLSRLINSVSWDTSVINKPKVTISFDFGGGYWNLQDTDTVQIQFVSGAIKDQSDNSTDQTLKFVYSVAN